MDRLREIAELLGVAPDAFAAPVEPLLLHASANGDRWFVLRDADGMLIVRHVGDAASGGQVVDRRIANFLDHDRGSPQHTALLHLIETALDTYRPSIGPAAP